MLTRTLRRVGVFTLAYLGLATSFALARGNQEFLLYIAVIVVLIPLIWIVHRRVGLSSGALWCLSAWGLAHMCGGLVPIPERWPFHGDSAVLYSLWLVPGGLKYDHVVHAFGFGVTTWVCWQALASMIGRPRRPSFGMLVLSVAGGMGFGAFNEVVEFAATLFVPETNVGGYLNTGWDLVANLVGGAVAAVLIRLFSRQSSKRIESITASNSGASLSSS